MKIAKNYPAALMFALAGVAILGGCQSPSAQDDDHAEISQVQGISFNDPLPVTAETAELPVSPQSEPSAPVTPAAVELDLSQPASAKTMPLDLASIPTATPVPSPTPDAAPAAEPEPEPEPTTVADAGQSADFVPVSFNVLSGFKYTEPIPEEGEKPEDVEKRRESDQIPAEVKALNGKKAVVEGWMVPMEVAEDGSVKSFVLVRTQPQCCFGDMQAMNEWVDVTMKGKTAEFNVDLPMKVYGQLEVGEKMEDGFVLSIYRMKADRVEL